MDASRNIYFSLLPSLKFPCGPLSLYPYHFILMCSVSPVLSINEQITFFIVYIIILIMILSLLEVSVGADVVERQVTEPFVNKVLTEFKPGLYTHWFPLLSFFHLLMMYMM